MPIIALAAKAINRNTVHDGSVGSIEEMDRKLALDPKLSWGGRDLPFLVALDGGGQVRVPGTGRYADGATTAAYLVSGLPATLVVDRDGTVVRVVNLNDPSSFYEADKLIDRLLATQTPPTCSASSTSSSDSICFGSTTWSN
jgi:hypothetical protein